MFVKQSPPGEHSGEATKVLPVYGAVITDMIDGVHLHPNEKTNLWSTSTPVAFYKKGPSLGNHSCLSNKYPLVTPPRKRSRFRKYAEP